MLLVSILCVASPALSQSTPLDEHERALLAACAVVPARDAELRTVTHGELHASGIPRVEWSTERPIVAFLPISANEGWLAESGVAEAPLDESSVSAWRRELRGRRVVEPGTRLRLVQEGTSARARGAVVVRAPIELGEQPAIVREIASGCSMEHLFRMPFALGSEPVTLEFAWDLHSPVDLTGLAVHLVAEGELLAPIPVELSVPLPPIVVFPPRLEFTSSTTSGWIGVQVPGGALPRLDAVHTPPCTRATAYEERDGAIHVRIEETPLARHAHVCGSLLVEAFVGSDALPFTRYVGVVHREPSVDPAGLRVLRSTFLPGERIVMSRDASGVLQLAFPDRMPAACDALAPNSILGTARVPTTGSDFATRIESNGVAVLVSGPIDPGIEELVPYWNAMH